MRAASTADHGDATPETVELNSSRANTNASAALFGVQFPPAAVAATHRPYLAFPNVQRLPRGTAGDRVMSVGVVTCPPGATIELHSGSRPGDGTGMLLATFTCEQPGAFTATFSYGGSSAGDDLMLVYSSGTTNGSAVLDWFNLTQRTSTSTSTLAPAPAHTPHQPAPAHSGRPGDGSLGVPAAGGKQGYIQYSPPAPRR